MPENSDPLAGRLVLVIGATGFIGTRLIEKLMLERGAHVRALVRNWGHAARIARFDLDLVGGQLEDAESLRRAAAGADVIFNLAYVTSNDVAANVEAASNLVAAALENQVRRVVHTSTFSIHEPFGDRVIDADTPPGPGAYDYPEAKIAVEAVIREAISVHGLPAVIIRPSIVYGPFGGYWTDRPARNLQRERVMLPNEGQGLCNAVFIDDLVDALILSAIDDDAVGETFLISGPAPVTWREFYEAIERHIGVKTLRLQTATQNQGRSDEKTAPRRSRSGTLRRVARLAASKAYTRLTSAQKRRLRRFLRKTGLLRPRNTVSDDYDYSARPQCRIDKAQEILGYRPRFDFELGMAVTGAYLRWAYPSPSGDLYGQSDINPG